MRCACRGLAPAAAPFSTCAATATSAQMLTQKPSYVFPQVQAEAKPAIRIFGRRRLSPSGGLPTRWTQAAFTVATRFRAETGISVTAAAAVSLDSIACDYYVGRRAATSRCLTMRCKHRQTPAVIYLQRGFAVLGIAGAGCYALLRGWLRAKQADLPEMQKVQPCHCAVCSSITDMHERRPTGATSNMQGAWSTMSATLMHMWHGCVQSTSLLSLQGFDGCCGGNFI